MIPLKKLSGEYDVHVTESIPSIEKKGKVLIVDDDEGMRDTLEAILKEDYSVLKARSGEEALRKLSHDILVVLLDIRLPGISGIEVLEQILARYPYIKCLMLSAVRDVDTVVECIKKGAHDFMTKELDYDVVHLRVRNAMALAKINMEHDQKIQKIMLLEGRLKKISQQTHPSQRNHFGSKRVDGPNLPEDGSLEEIFQRVGGASPYDFIARRLGGEDLTDQEQKILALVLKGLTNKKIAHKLNIKLPTVKTHLNNIFPKLGVTSRSQAIIYLLFKGLRTTSNT